MNMIQITVISDTSSMKKCKTQFRYWRKTVDKDYRQKFQGQYYHAGFGDSIADNMIQSWLNDYSHYYTPSHHSDDTLNWVEDNISFLKTKYVNYDDF